MWHLINTAQLRQIQQTLNQLIQEVEALAVDQATFDQHLQDLTTAVDELIAATQAHIAATPDFTEEAAAVTAATDKVQAATDALNADATQGVPESPPADQGSPADTTGDQPPA